MLKDNPIIINLAIALNTKDIEVIRKCAEGKNCYVEIGTYHGGSALIAKTAGVKEAYTIDNEDRYVFKDIDIGINFINKPSVEVAKGWDKPIDVLFIDGLHTEAYIDFLAWEKFVVKGGYILFHDYFENESDVKVKRDLRPILTDDRYEKIHIPENISENTSILQIRKL